jgi:hypothetical protein
VQGNCHDLIVNDSKELFSRNIWQCSGANQEISKNGSDKMEKIKNNYYTYKKGKDMYIRKRITVKSASRIHCCLESILTYQSSLIHRRRK